MADFRFRPKTHVSSRIKPTSDSLVASQTRTRTAASKLRPESASTYKIIEKYSEDTQQDSLVGSTKSRKVAKRVIYNRIDDDNDIATPPAVHARWSSAVDNEPARGSPCMEYRDLPCYEKQQERLQEQRLQLTSALSNHGSIKSMKSIHDDDNEEDFVLLCSDGVDVYRPISAEQPKPAPPKNNGRATSVINNLEYRLTTTKGVRSRRDSSDEKQLSGGNAVKSSQSYESPRYQDRYAEYLARQNKPQPAAGRYINQDKRVMFYRSHESSHPDLTLVISDNRFKDIDELIDDCAKILNLAEEERYVHMFDGRIVSSLEEFVHGASYFFGPPYTYSVEEQNLQQQDATPTENQENEAPQILRESRDSPKFDDVNKYGVATDAATKGLKRRKLRVITNTDNPTSYQFILDPVVHTSLKTVLGAINELVLPDVGQEVKFICTQKGRNINSVGELFRLPDKNVVAIVSKSDELHNSRKVLLDHYSMEPVAPQTEPVNQYPVKKLQPIPIMEPLPMRYYGDSHLRSVQISVNGRVHRFDPPSNYNPDFAHLMYHDGPPMAHMQLDWIYGFNSEEGKNSVIMTGGEEMVYYSSKIVILFNPEKHSQRYYDEHTDAVRCIAQHPNTVVFASGQASGGEPLGHIRIWDSKSLSTMATLNLGERDMSVEAVDFSKSDNGMKLASISRQSDNWFVHVWDWSAGRMLAKSTPYGSVEVGLQFAPERDDVLYTCGDKHVFFWKVNDDKVDRSEGDFGRIPEVPAKFTGMAFSSDNELITTDSNGYLHLWEKDLMEPKTSSVIKTIHTGAINAMLILPGDKLITGGEDRLLTLLDPDQLVPVVCKIELAEEVGAPTSIRPMKGGSFVGTDFQSMPLVLATSKNCIMSGTLEAGFTKVVGGVSEKVTALSVHPMNGTFITASRDCTVAMWGTKSHQELWTSTVQYPITAVTFSVSGDIALVGTDRGQWMVLNAKELQGATDTRHLATFQSDSDEITCFSFSPDGTVLAIGNCKGSIYLYQVYDDGKSYRFVETVKSYLEEIKAIDWSRNCQYIRYMTSEYDLGVWNIETKKEEVKRAFKRDIQWASDSCSLSYEASGAWSNTDESTFFNWTSRSSAGELLLAGTNHGGLRIFNYPADNIGAPFNEVRMHVGGVSQAHFLAEDNGVISVGSEDNCIAQWRLGLREEAARPFVPKYPQRVMYQVEDPRMYGGIPRHAMMGHPHYMAMQDYNDPRRAAAIQEYYNDMQDPRRGVIMQAPYRPMPVDKPVEGPYRPIGPREPRPNGKYRAKPLVANIGQGGKK